MALSTEQKLIRQIAWTRLNFLKKLLRTNNYKKDDIVSMITAYQLMYNKSNLDDKGKELAFDKLMDLLRTYVLN